MFGTPPVNVTAEKISFREHENSPIEVYFEERTLLFNKTALPSLNAAGETFSVTMEIGIIDKKYASKTYFNWPNQGIIGLAPSTQTDSKLLKR